MSSRRSISLLVLAVLASGCGDTATPTSSASPPGSAPSAVLAPTGSTDLGTLGGEHSQAEAVNEAGWIVGMAHAPDVDASHPLLFGFVCAPGGTLQSLGRIPTERSPDPQFMPSGQSHAYDINDAGQVVGRAWDYDCLGGACFVPFIWSAGTGMRRLVTTGGVSGTAYAINGAGTVVGESSGAAFIWTGGSTQSLGVLSGLAKSSARDINDAGVVVGFAGSDTYGGSDHRAFVWTSATGMVTLGVLPGRAYSMAHGVNASGQVVGESGGHAFVWTPAVPNGTSGTMVDIGPGIAYAINDAGVVTGVSGAHAFMWTATGGMIFLPEVAGSWGSEGFDLNDSGEIVGYDYPGGLVHATVWQLANVNGPPVAAASTPAPAVEGAVVSLSAAGSNDPEGHPISYRWDFGDGTSASTGLRSTPYNVGHRFPDQGSYTVVLSVTDGQGLVGVDSVMVTVTNAAPTGRFDAPSSILEGSRYTLGFSTPTDSGAADRAVGFTYSFDCGAGAGYSAWSGTRSLSCANVMDQGGRVIRGRIRDKDGAEREYTRNLVIANAKPVPTLSAASATTFAAGGSLSVAASFTDRVGTDGPWQWRVVWGDGSNTGGW